MAHPDDSVASAQHGRRRVVAGFAASAAAGLLAGDTVGERRLGAADLDRLDLLVARYRALDHEQGGGALADHLGRFAGASTALLGARVPASLAPRLLTTVAGIHQLAGWTAFDVGRHEAAGRHFAVAEHAALSAGDDLFVARVRYSRARQQQHLHDNVGALLSLRRALAGVGSRGTPGVQAMLFGAEAASLAAIGDRPGALGALGRAEESYARMNRADEPGWLGFLGAGEVLAQHGRVYRDLARDDRARFGTTAVDRVSRAIGAFGPGSVRSTLLNEVGLASALFLADEPEEAVRVGRAALARAPHVRSRRVADRLANLRRDLAGHAGLPAVAVFERSLPGRPG